MNKSVWHRPLGVAALDAYYQAAAVEMAGGKTIYQAIAELMDLRLEIAGETANIPKTGPLIVVANHPTGGMEVFLILNALLALRSDVKVLSHGWFSRYVKFAEQMICVDRGNGAKATSSNLRPMRDALRWVKHGGLLVLFPAGVVATYRRDLRTVADGPWHAELDMLIEKTHADVLPIYAHGRNSTLFYLASAIHDRLGAMLLAREMLRKRGTTMKICFGSLVKGDELNEQRGSRLSFLRRTVDELGAKEGFGGPQPFETGLIQSL